MSKSRVTLTLSTIGPRPSCRLGPPPRPVRFPQVPSEPSQQTQPRCRPLCAAPRPPLCAPPVSAAPAALAGRQNPHSNPCPAPRCPQWRPSPSSARLVRPGLWCAGEALAGLPTGAGSLPECLLPAAGAAAGPGSLPTAAKAGRVRPDSGRAAPRGRSDQPPGAPLGPWQRAGAPMAAAAAQRRGGEGGRRGAGGSKRGQQLGSSGASG